MQFDYFAWAFFVTSYWRIESKISLLVGLLTWKKSCNYSLRNRMKVCFKVLNRSTETSKYSSVAYTVSEFN